MIEPGGLIGPYRVHSLVGRGGMGAVFLAEHVNLGRRVALKVIASELAADPTFQARFEREARHAASLDHPNVVPVYEAGEDGGHLYLAMRYVDGVDLRQLLADRGQLTADEAVAIAAQVAAALGAAHEAGLVHRDVKPANVLLAGEDADAHVYLADFGLTKSRETTAGMTAPDQWVGTLDYVAPEQIEAKEVDGRADVYSLGCVLFQMVTGAVPFTGLDPQKLYGHLMKPVPSVAEAAPDAAWLDDVIRKATAKDPAVRFGSAGELAVALERRREPDEPPGPPTPPTRPIRPTPPEPQPKRRIPWWVPVAAIAVIVCVVAIAMLLAPSEPEARDITADGGNLRCRVGPDRAACQVLGREWEGDEVPDCAAGHRPTFFVAGSAPEVSCSAPFADDGTPLEPGDSASSGDFECVADQSAGVTCENTETGEGWILSRESRGQTDP